MKQIELQIKIAFANTDKEINETQCSIQSKKTWITTFKFKYVKPNDQFITIQRNQTTPPHETNT